MPQYAFSILIPSNAVAVCGAGSVLSASATVDGGGEFDLQGFSGWLRRKGLSEGHSKDMVLYAQKYGHVLFHGQLSLLEGVAGERHVMAALANLSKYLGKYDEWRRLRERSGLRWKQSVSGDDAFMRLYSGKEDMEHMERWMDEARQKLGWDCWFPIALCALTGLRETEMLMCLNRIAAEGFEAYPLNLELGCLEHFRVLGKDGKPIFWRRNKKSYISVVSDGLLECLRNWKTVPAEGNDGEWQPI